jgi:cytochrome bd-type quinol oxidase subunit 1
MSDILFYLILGFLFTHELDAIQRREWRLFFFLAPFGDAVAFRLFTLLHIPLFVWIMWAAQFPTFQIGFSAFVIIHAGLHWLLRRHPHYEFNNSLSWFLIAGPVPLAVVHLAWMTTSTGAVVPG